MRWPTLILLLVLSVVPRTGRANPYVALLEQRAAQLERLRRQPGGVVALHGLLRELWGWVPTHRIEAVLDLARQRDSHPLVRSLAVLLAARVARDLGQDVLARDLRRRAGVIPRWFLCGPLPTQGLDGHDRRFRVEQDLSDWPRFDRRYRGKPPLRWVSWRPLPVPTPEIQLSLASFLGSHRMGAVVYLQTLVRARRAQAAALRLGTAGPFKVFLNGREVAARTVTRPVAPDQDVVGLALPAGTSRLVLKLTNQRGSWNVFARLTAPDGGELVGLSFPRDVPRQEPVGAEPGRPLPVVSPEAWLEQRASSRAGLKDWVEYLLRATPRDPAGREVEAALDRWVKQDGSAASHLLRARIRRDPDGQRREAALALRIAPGDPWALLKLAQLDAVAQRRLRSGRSLRRILAADPGFLPAQIELSEAYRGVGLDATAAAHLDRLLKRHPDLAGVVLERANLAMAQDDTRRAEQLLQRYLKSNHQDVSTRRALADLALRRGDAVGGIRQLSDAVASVPHLPFLRLELGQALEGQGRITEAARQYRMATRIDPYSVRALEHLGHALRRAGQRRAAWAAWRRALRIQPQNAELRRYLSMLSPRRRWGLAEGFRQDPAGILRAARKRGARGPAPARVLLESRVAEVHESGLSRTLHQRLVEVVSEAGIPAASSYHIAYNPDRQTVDLRVARVHRASGRLSQASRREHDLSEPWAGLWYDLRSLEVSFPNLRPGDIVELEYVVDDVAESNLLADYFGDIVHLQRQIPVERFSYTVITPATRSLYIRGPRLEQARHRRWRQGKATIHQWTARGVAGIHPEPGMPGWTSVADYIHVSTYSGWPGVGRWYWNLIHEQLEPTSTIVETARRLTAQSNSAAERLQAIHNFVARNTRYVGLELGIHSYKPYSAAQVLARRFGDCKDKATLMIALLKQAGIDAEMVLVRTRRRGDVDAQPASLAPFDHAIVYVPDQQLYLDATAEFAGTRELPFQDQGVMALHVRPGGEVRLTRTPVLPAGENLSRVRERLEIEAGGKVRLHEERSIRGQAASDWRSHYQAPDSRRQRYERTWNGWVGGATLLRVKMPHLEDLERPVEVESEVVLDGLTRSEARGRISLPAGSGPERSLVQTYGRLTRRRHALQLDYPWRSVSRSQLVAPQGWRFVVVPEDRLLTSPFGRFSRRTLKQKGELVVTQEFQVEQALIPPESYPAFRRFLQRIDRWRAERVILAPQG